QVLQMMNDPQRQAAVGELISMLQGGEDSQQAVRQLLASLNSASPEGAQQLMRMLNNAEERPVARLMMTQLAAAERDVLLSVMRNPAQARAAETMLSMLRSNESAQMTGLRNLLSANNETRQQFISMLNAAESRTGARQLLSRIATVDQLNNLGNLSRTPSLSGAYAEIQSMLSSSDPQIRQAGLTALEFGLGRNSTAPEILNMLNDPASRRDARQILMNSDAFTARNIALMMSNPDSRASGQALLNMLNDPAQRPLVQTLARSGPAQVQAFLDLRANPQTADAARMVQELLSDDDSSSMGSQLLSMLSSRNATERQRGLELAGRLADENSREGAQALLQLGLSSQDLAQMIGIANNPQSQSAASRISSLLSDTRNIGNRNAGLVLLQMLNSTEAATRQEGQRLLAMMNDSRHQDAALRQLRLRTPVFNSGKMG
ncbi:MAG: hypothetical protein K2X27_15605, partial [Candidatus Obscuribacterales bacterium]|nr:hypothetical protein [Candidatus Obscuribacterales bacterium]